MKGGPVFHHGQEKARATSPACAKTMQILKRIQMSLGILVFFMIHPLRFHVPILIGLVKKWYVLKWLSART
jgi:hypothetical protein